jgi:glycine hydroxymethyltransferase
MPEASFPGHPESAAFRAALEVVRAAEPRVADAIAAELADQRGALKLIASENYASPAVLLAMGNWLSDKYAEGTAGRRVYAELFGMPYAYVQPHSGIDANLVAFWAVLAQRVEAPALRKAQVRHVNDLSGDDWARLRQELGNQRLLGMSLDAGGHLTHGFRPNISGKMFDQASYGTDPVTGLIDYDAVRALAREFRPLIVLAGYSAYPRLVNFRVMREIADEAGATLMADMAHFAGLVAGGVLAGDFSPVGHAQIITTTTHKSLRGPRGGMVLCEQELAEYVARGCPMVLGGPLPHVMAAKAVALAEARRPEFAVYARRIVQNAAALAEGLLRRGITLVSGGTDNHLVLIDVSGYGLTGRQAESALVDSGIVTNRNAIPADPNGAWYTSGIRLGTPALTTRGLGPADMDDIAGLIDVVLSSTRPAAPSGGPVSKARYMLDAEVAAKVAGQAAELLARYPLYPSVQLG